MEQTGQRSRASIAALCRRRHAKADRAPAARPRRYSDNTSPRVWCSFPCYYSFLPRRGHSLLWNCVLSRILPALLNSFLLGVPANSWTYIHTTITVKWILCLCYILDSYIYSLHAGRLAVLLGRSYLWSCS